MKKFFSIALASAALVSAAPAFAAAVNIDLTSMHVDQYQDDNVNQTAVSAAAAIGSIVNSNQILSTAVNVGQLASETVVVDQTAWLGNLAAERVTLDQQVDGRTTQHALSIAGSGSQNTANLTSSTAANLGQSANLSVNVHQH